MADLGAIGKFSDVDDGGAPAAAPSGSAAFVAPSRVAFPVWDTFPAPQPAALDVHLLGGALDAGSGEIWVE